MAWHARGGGDATRVAKGPAGEEAPSQACNQTYRTELYV